MQHVAFKVFTT